MVTFYKTHKLLETKRELLELSISRAITKSKQKDKPDRSTPLQIPYGVCFPLPALRHNLFSSTHKICSSHQIGDMLWEHFEDQIEPHVPLLCPHH